MTGGGVILTGNGARTNIARLNIDGTLDITFQNGMSGAVPNWVSSVALQNDGKVLIAGSFDQVNDIPRPYLARLWGSADIPPVIKTIAKNDGTVSVTWDALPGRRYIVQDNADLSENWSDIPGDAPSVSGTATKTVTIDGNSRRFYRVRLLP